MIRRPLGENVEDTATRGLPGAQGFQGEFIELRPIDPITQVQDLFSASHGSEEKTAIWTYMPMSGPFESQDHMESWLERCREFPGFIFYAVYEIAKSRYVGMTSFCNMVPDMQRLEVGFIWYGLDAQRTKANTESIYLMLCEAFDRLKYRRVEWKCDSLNQPSRVAALRLGFRFEGVFRKHMIVNGHNRDTAWFAVADTDWPIVKANMQKWLYSSDENFSLREANRPVVE